MRCFANLIAGPVQADNPHRAGSSGLYDRARPDYPLEAIETILSQTQPGAHVIELGAGTGLFTRGFLKAASNSAGRVAKVTAVEPSEGMRQGFAAKLPPQTDIQVECVDGLFDKIPAPDASADLVRSRLDLARSLHAHTSCTHQTPGRDCPGEFASLDHPTRKAEPPPARQAFHWVGHDGRAAVEEIARVLKPGGVWALIWNLEDRDVPWIAQIREKYEQFEQGAAASRRF